MSDLAIAICVLVISSPVIYLLYIFCNVEKIAYKQHLKRMKQIRKNVLCDHMMNNPNGFLAQDPDCVAMFREEMNK